MMRFELYRDAKGDWRWRLRHQNGNVIADSGEGYRSRQDCEHGIDLVKTLPSAITTVDMSAKIAGSGHAQT